MRMENSKMKKIVLTAFVVFLIASPAFAALRPNDAAPTFSLRDGTGRDFSLSDVVGEKAREKVNGVVLSFFASWCIPCRKELPVINSLVDELKGKGIKVIIVDVRESIETMNALLAELKVDKPIALSDRDGKAAETYQVRGLPTTFFIGGDGKVKGINFGEIADVADLRKGAAKLVQ